MLGKKYLSPLKIIYKILNKSKIFWAIIGKTNLALQGLEVNPKQIGIIIRVEDLDDFLELFNEFGHTEIEELDNKEAKEFNLTVGGTGILVCAEYDHGTYFQVKKEIVSIEFCHMKLPCYSLISEREAYKRLGLIKTYRLINNFLEKKR